MDLYCFSNGADDAFSFANKNSLFAHNRFSTVVFSMKMAEFEKSSKKALIDSYIPLDIHRKSGWAHFALQKNMDFKVLVIGFNRSKLSEIQEIRLVRINGIVRTYTQNFRYDFWNGLRFQSWCHDRMSVNLLPKPEWSDSKSTCTN